MARGVFFLSRAIPDPYIESDFAAPQLAGIGLWRKRRLRRMLFAVRKLASGIRQIKKFLNFFLTLTIVKMTWCQRATERTV